MIEKKVQVCCSSTLAMLLLSIISCTLFSSTAFSEEATTEAMESVAEVGRTCALGGDVAGADAALSQLYSQYSTQPQVVPAIERVAQTFFSKNNIAKAQAIYSDAITKISADHPDAVWLHKRVILCQIAQGNITGADVSIEAFKNDFSGKPQFSTVLLGVADDYLTYNRYDKAKDILQYVAQNTSDASLAVKAKAEIARCEMCLGNGSAADQVITALMNDYPESPELCDCLLALAKDYEKLKKLDKAKTLFQYVAQNSSDSSLAIKGLTGVACLDIKLGNASDANQAITALKAAASQDTKFCANLNTFAGDLQVIGEHDKARDLYQYVALNSPDSNTAINAQKMAAIMAIFSGNDAAADAAIEKLKNNFSSHPQLCQHVHDIAMKYWFNKEYAKARGLYYYVSQNSSDKKMAFFSLERALKCELRLDNHGAMAEAIESLSGLDSASEDYVDKVLTICGVYIKTYDPAAALPYVNSALQVSTDSEKTKKLLDIKAKCYAGMGDDEQANAVISEIAQSDATNEEYFGTLNRTADKYREEGHYQKSIELYQQVINSSADEDLQLDAHVGIARSNFQLVGDPNAADSIHALCRDFADHEKFTWACYVIAEDCYYKKNYQKAGEIFRLPLKTSRTHKDHGEMAYLTAYCSAKIKDRSTAMEYYHLIMDKYPKSKYANRVPYRLGEAYVQIKDYEKAIYWFDQQIKSYNHKFLTDRSSYLIGAIYCNNLKDYEKAIEVYLDYQNKFPNGGGRELVRYMLAKCYDKLGRTGDAVTTLQEALTKYPDGHFADDYQKMLTKLQGGR